MDRSDPAFQRFRRRSSGWAMDGEQRPTKREVFLTFLQEGWVSLHLDARRMGVVLPSSLSPEPHLVLQYGRNMPIPIPDLEITDGGVGATLSFSRAPHRTFVPWTSVYAVACTDGRGVLYEEDVPPEVSLFVAGDHEAGRREGAINGPSNATIPLAPGARPTPRTAAHLRSVPAEDQPVEVAVAPETPDDAPAASQRRKRPQLRLVK